MTYLGSHFVTTNLMSVRTKNEDAGNWVSRTFNSISGTTAQTRPRAHSFSEYRRWPTTWQAWKKKIQEVKFQLKWRSQISIWIQDCADAEVLSDEIFTLVGIEFLFLLPFPVLFSRWLLNRRIQLIWSSPVINKFLTKTC